MNKQNITQTNQDLFSYLLAVLLKISINFIYYFIFTPLFFLLVISLLLIILQLLYILVSLIIIIFKEQGLIQITMFVLDIIKQPYQIKTTINIDINYLLKIYTLIITGITLMDLFLQKIFNFQISKIFNQVKIKKIVIILTVILAIQIILNIYFQTFAGIFIVIAWYCISLLFLSFFLAITKHFSMANESVDKIIKQYHAS